MPDKLTDNEIIKALECCTKCNSDCEKCEIKDFCEEQNSEINKAILDLINRLQAENEKLKKSNETFADIGKLYSEIKAEAYKEFWNSRPERLNEKCEGKEEYNKGWNACLDEFWDIRNNLFEELVGEQSILNDVKCIDCEYLELELPYAVCSKAYKGMVQPNDSCGKGKLKELVGEKNVD